MRLESTLLASGGPGQPVTAYSLLGQILQRLNEYDEYEDALREAVRLAQAEQGARQRSAFIALLHLSALLNERGKPREAARYAQLALAQGEHDYGASAPILIPALYTLAQAESTLGELAAALRAFERAGAIIAAHGANVQPAYLVRHHRGYGALLVELGDRDAGLQELRRALELSAADHSLATDRAATLVSAAAVVRRLDPATAQIYLAEAFTLLQERLPADHPQLLRAVNGMCRIEIENGTAPFPACADASARLGRARHADPALRQAVLENQSELALRRHEPAQLSYALESLAAATTLSTPDPMWRADFLVARVLHEQHRNALAILCVGLVLAACGSKHAPGGGAAGGGSAANPGRAPAGNASAEEVAAQARADLRCPARVKSAARAAGAPVDDVLGVRPGMTYQEAADTVLCSNELLVLQTELGRGFNIKTFGQKLRPGFAARPAEARVQKSSRQIMQEMQDSALARGGNAVVHDLQPGQAKWYVGTVGLPDAEIVVNVAREEWFQAGHNPTLAGRRAGAAWQVRQAHPPAAQQRRHLHYLGVRPGGTSDYETSPLYNRCTGGSDPDGGVSLSPDCGEVVAAIVYPLPENTELARSMQVGVVDQAQRLPAPHRHRAGARET